MKTLLISLSLLLLCACQEYGQPTETEVKKGSQYGSSDSNKDKDGPDSGKVPGDKGDSKDRPDIDAPAVLNIVEKPPAKLPETLAELDIYTNKGVLNDKIPFLDYQVHSPLWSDGAIKTRLLLVPKGNETLNVPESGSIVFPVGTILVKHFVSELDNYPVETRMMLRKPDATWEYATYRWAADGSTKRMKMAEEIAPNNAWPKGYRVPAEAECSRCHSADTAEVIGFTPHQVKGDLDKFAERKILASDGLERFKRSIPQPDAKNKMLSAELRAKSYMDVNCSNCHQPREKFKIIGLGSSQWDWASSLKVPEKLTGNALSDSPIITPGNPEKSKLYLRFVAKKNRMPGNSVVVDPVGEEVLRNWIMSIPATCTASDTSTCGEKATLVGR